LILVRPIIRANQDRAYNAHVFVFFIFLVANIGGSLTPLGDPSLFVGFLKGVDFLWPLEHMLAPMLLASGVLLALFYVVDRLVWSRESEEVRGKRRVRRQIRIEGVHNRIYLGVVAVTVLASGIWGDSTTEPIGIGIEMP
jgi:Na+/H+ antiporter NhaD/arsenite permease-like protein